MLGAKLKSKNANRIIFIIITLLVITLSSCKKNNDMDYDDYEGYWFILAELDENGEEIQFYGMTRFNIDLSADSDFTIYSERYNYSKKIWEDRSDDTNGKYKYNMESNELEVQIESGDGVAFRKGEYNGVNIVEMFPISNEIKEKTILTRTNPKPK